MLSLRYSNKILKFIIIMIPKYYFFIFINSTCFVMVNFLSKRSVTLKHFNSNKVTSDYLTVRRRNGSRPRKWARLPSRGQKTFQLTVWLQNFFFLLFAKLKISLDLKISSLKCMNRKHWRFNMINSKIIFKC